MPALLLPIVVTLLPLALIMYVVYHFAGKRAGNITVLVTGAVLLIMLVFALVGAPAATKEAAVLYL